jgi:hypothetical protein
MSLKQKIQELFDGYGAEELRYKLPILLELQGKTLGLLDEVAKSPQLLEKLAELEHKQWSHLIKYQLRQCPNVLGIADFAKWERLASTPYHKLTEEQKEADRKFARIALKEVLGLEGSK